MHRDAASARRKRVPFWLLTLVTLFGAIVLNPTRESFSVFLETRAAATVAGSVFNFAVSRPARVLGLGDETYTRELFWSTAQVVVATLDTLMSPVMRPTHALDDL